MSLILVAAAVAFAAVKNKPLRIAPDFEAKWRSDQSAVSRANKVLDASSLLKTKQAIFNN